MQHAIPVHSRGSALLIAAGLAMSICGPASSQVSYGIGTGTGIGAAAGTGNGARIGPSGMMSMRSDNGGTVMTYNYPPGATIAAITGAPYSGHQSSQSTQTLANGTHLNQALFEQPMTYRDTMGRTRTGRNINPGPLGRTQEPPVVVAEILDPVAGYRYILDPVNKIAHRVVVQVRQSQATVARASASTAAVMQAMPPVSRTMENGATMTTENLGTQTIMGVPAMGTKTTTVYPAGTFQGNDAPVSMVNEMWMSLQYGVALKSVSTQPTGGTNTMTMKDFSTDEPDPALFLVPAGYQVVDETGQFTITIPRPAQ